VAVVQDLAGVPRLELFSEFANLLAADIRLIVIDVPIGIMTRVPRDVDAAERKALGHRACCVFSSPYQSMLAARTHPEASNLRERIDGKRSSRQAFEITTKTAEVDALMTPNLPSCVREGHPEITFATMMGGVPMVERKRSAAGRAARLAALRPCFPEFDSVAEARRPSGVGADHVLDAYAMLWTAGRLDAGTSQRLPGPHASHDQRDDKGLSAEMIA
jgi:predicted RNase H-like nuclease